jgi:hypothetical protein
MQIYNTTNTENSLVHEAWALVDADITSYPLATVIRRFNIAYEELVGDIINADGVWQYDDTNYTDHPRGKGTLVEGQQDYAFSSEYLQIESVEIMDTAKVHRKIRMVDQNDTRDRGLDETYGVDSSGNPLTGFPEVFDINGDTIRLYPAPTATDCTLTNGLRVNFKRAPDLFTVSDTTQQPGLPSSYHSILAYKAALPYAAIYKKDRVVYLTNEITRLHKAVIDHYTNRDKMRDANITTHCTRFE